MGFFSFMADPLASMFGMGPVINPITKPVITNPTMHAIGEVALPAVGGYLGGPVGAALGSMAGEGAYQAAGGEGNDITALKKGAISGLTAGALTGLSGMTGIGGLDWGGQASGWGTPTDTSGGLTGLEGGMTSPSPDIAMTPNPALDMGGQATTQSSAIPISGAPGGAGPTPYSDYPAGMGPQGYFTGTPPDYANRPPGSMWDKLGGMFGGGGGEAGGGGGGGMGGYLPYVMGASALANIGGNLIQSKQNQANLGQYIAEDTWTPAKASAYQQGVSRRTAGTLAGAAAKSKGTLAEQMAAAGRGGGGYGREALGIDEATLNALAGARNQALTTTSMPPNLSPAPFMSQTSPWASSLTGMSGVGGNLATNMMTYQLLQKMGYFGNQSNSLAS